jgi:N-acetylglucosaminyldiphosphoundecaprenol N-acetyl-beta-D-mannosaminyltransferase
MSKQAIHILGIRVDNVSMAEAVERTIGFAASGQFHQVATVNPEFIVAAQRNPDFAGVLNGSDLAVPDGVGLIVAARWRRHPLSERVPGVELVEQVAARAAKQGLRIYLLGAQPGIAAAAAQRLQERCPGLVVAGTFSGSPRLEDEEAILTRLQEAQPHILFVAYGAPQQDLWIARNRSRLGAGVAMGVGGAFDFIAGHSRRAPDWVRRLGLEWLHRLIREPWRWRRMLALPRFALAVIRER